MSVTCFVSYEIHPTTWGGCGVLIHHAAEHLLAAGHQVVLLLDVPESYFQTFVDKDRLGLSNPDRCRAYRVDALCEDFAFSQAQVPCIFQYKSLRFLHALRKVQALERPDFVEFFDYCGPGYYTFVDRLFARQTSSTPVLGCRLHGTIEILDRFGAGSAKDIDRLTLYAMEHRALALAESVLSPSNAYYEAFYRGVYELEPERAILSPPPKLPFAPVTGRPSSKGAFNIVFIGRMFHLKGVDQFVHAAVMLLKRRPDLTCNVELIGYDSTESPVPGSYTKYLQTLIPARLRERFVFTGQLSHDGISQRLNQALFAVFPNRTESFCYALHEAYDAGVPVIVNDLPAFRDFFTHERNALVYDSSTGGLAAAMEQLIGDDSLRERLCRPYPVAEHPLGPFYDQPIALRALGDRSPSQREGPGVGSLVTEGAAPAQPGDAQPPLIVVLCSSSDVAGSPALASLAEQTTQHFKVVCLVPTQPDAEETLWWLGRPWHIRGRAGEPIEASDVITTHEFAVLRAEDRLDPTWLELCQRALARRAELAFAGTWLQRAGVVQPLTLDVLPELYPFERGSELPRALARTLPGTLLCDLLDPSLGNLGLIGYLWSAVTRWGHGALLPTPMVHAAHEPHTTPDPGALNALLLRFGRAFPDRLTLLTAILNQRAAAADPAPQPSLPDPPGSNGAANGDVTIEHKIKVADELGGRTLARLAIKKLARRVISPAGDPTKN